MFRLRPNNEGSRAKAARTSLQITNGAARNQSSPKGLLHCNGRGNPMSDEISCPNCESPSVVYSEATKGDGPVVCGACGAFRASRGQFRHLLERHAARSGLLTTGC
jgi:ribosomal protein S27E